MDVVVSRQQARLKMELANGGRELPKGMVVHHKDGNPFNNDFSNLQLMSNSEHVSYHGKNRPHRESMGRKRQKGFQGRLSHEEETMLLQLSDREGVTKIQWFRTLIRREWQKYFGEKRPEDIFKIETLAEVDKNWNQEKEGGRMTYQEMAEKYDYYKVYANNKKGWKSVRVKKNTPWCVWCGCDANKCKHNQRKEGEK